MTVCWEAMLSALSELGFKTQWVSLSVASVGSPQRRRGLFVIAKRGRSLAVMSPPVLAYEAAGVLADGPASDARLELSFALAVRAERLGFQFRASSCERVVDVIRSAQARLVPSEVVGQRSCATGNRIWQLGAWRPESVLCA